jgi:transcriptional regulator GlxA family with amidase domain
MQGKARAVGAARPICGLHSGAFLLMQLRGVLENLRMS